MAKAVSLFESTEATQRAYWERRANSRMAVSNRNDAEADKTTREAYAAAKAKVDKSIRDFYAKYAKNDAVSLVDALTRLSTRDKVLYIKAMKENGDNIRTLIDSGKLKDNRWIKAHLKHIDSIKPTQAITRRQALIDEIDHNVTMLAADSESRLATIMYDRYEAGFSDTIQGLNRYDSRIGTLLGSPAPKQIEMASREQWLGDDFSSRIWKDKTRLIAAVRSNLTQSFVQGLGADANAKLLAKDIGSSLSNAKRVFRTESSHISEKATFDAYDAAHITEYEFICGFYERVCSRCGPLHRKKFKIKDGIVGINKAPLHPNCRCTSGAVINGSDFAWIDELIKEG